MNLFEGLPTISAITTDHCDYTLAQKEEFKEFTKTPGGLPGLETSFRMTYTFAVHEMEERQRAGESVTPLPVSELARLMSAEPARLFGLYPNKGALLPGSDADIMIYDPLLRATIKTEDLHTIGGYNPYHGMQVQGQIRTVLSRGQVIVHDGHFAAEEGRGRFLKGMPFHRI